MARIAQVWAIILALLAVLVLITSLATSDWMVACMDSSSILQMMKAGGMGTLPASVQAMFTGKLCFKTGLFKFAYSILTIDAGVALPISSMDSFVRITIGLLFFSMLLIIVGVIFIIMSSCSDSMSHRRKAAARTYNGIGAVVLTFGAIFLLGGALAYTVPQSKVIHNPIMWSAQLGNTVSKVFSKSLSSGMGGASLFGGAGDSNLNSEFSSLLGGSSSTNPLKDLENLGSKIAGDSNLNAEFSNLLGGSSSTNPLGDLEKLGSKIIPSSMPNLEDLLGHGRKKRQAPGSSSSNQVEAATRLLSGIDPMFGYSFYLAWAAAGLAFLAAILSALAWCCVAAEYPGALPLDSHIGRV
uniref:Uncharacterized protein n=1 Tax=Ciona savignyi TaxID=51511 RepID=H2YVG8_CIOSA